MKKILAFLLVVISVTSGIAQTEKGSWLISANSNLGYNSLSYPSGGSNLSAFNIGVRAGGFLADNFALGANISYYSLSQGGSSSNASTFGAFARYYANKIFFGAGFNAVSQGSGSGSSSSATTIPIELGFAGFITKNFAIEPSINYVKGSEPNGGVPFLGIPTGANGSIGLNVAFTLYLGKKGE